MKQIGSKFLHYVLLVKLVHFLRLCFVLAVSLFQICLAGGVKTGKADSFESYWEWLLKLFEELSIRVRTQFILGIVQVI